MIAGVLASSIRAVFYGSDSYAPSLSHGARFDGYEAVAAAAEAVAAATKAVTAQPTKAVATTQPTKRTSTEWSMAGEGGTTEPTTEGRERTHRVAPVVAVVTIGAEEIGAIASVIIIIVCIRSGVTAIVAA